MKKTPPKRKKLKIPPKPKKYSVIENRTRPYQPTWAGLLYSQNKNPADNNRQDFCFGPPEGIRTPVLQNRNLLRYPAAPQAEMCSRPMSLRAAAF